ncbi:MAG: hypothetical protein HKO03_09545 [Acidimicrobiia bacterium]|nr:hypothetical protein [Acidimicrobiia bacterium]
MEIVLWLTVVAIAALLLLLIVMMWRSWRRRVPAVFSAESVGKPAGRNEGKHAGSHKPGTTAQVADGERAELADADGPVDSPYPPGARPAGPGAEGMAVSSPGEIVPGWNENGEFDEEEQHEIEEDGENGRTSDRDHLRSAVTEARGIMPPVDS